MTNYTDENLEQYTLFESSPYDAFKALRPGLIQVIKKNFLDDKLLRFAERKTCYTIEYNEMLIARIPKLKKKKKIEIKKAEPNSEDFVSYTLDDYLDAESLSDECCAALRVALDSIPKGFSCCSRYVECSDRRACCHPDHDMRLQCYYRRVLASGRVFYGKNAEH